MATLKTNFILDSKGESGLIIMTISYGYSIKNLETGKNGYKQIKISTGKNCAKKEWQKFKENPNSAKGKVLTADFNRLTHNVESVYNQFLNDNEPSPAPEMFKHAVKKRLGLIQPVKFDQTLVSFINSYIEYESNKVIKAKTPLTIKHYKTFRNKIEHFNAGLKITELTESNFNKLIEHQNKKHLDKTGKPLLTNTVWDIQKFWNQFANLVKKKFNHIEVYMNKDKNYVYAVKGITPAISIHQLKQLIESKISNPDLDHVRDVFVCSILLGGLRYGSTENLPSIKLDKGMYVLVHRLKKGENPPTATVPILKPVLDIYQKYGNKFPKPLTNQAMNRNLKKLFKELKIKETIRIEKKYINGPLKSFDMLIGDLVSTHSARKTFITIFLSLGISKEVLKKITGHTDGGSKDKFNVYDNVSGIMNAERFLKDLKRVSHEIPFQVLINQQPYKATKTPSASVRVLQQCNTDGLVFRRL